MHQAVIYIDPVGPAPVGFAQAAGMPGDIRFDFKTQGNLAYPDIASLYPQLVLRPFTRPDIHAYDIEINDPTGASGIAKVPGVVMNDRFSHRGLFAGRRGPPAADARRRPGRSDRLRLRLDRTARPRQLPDGPQRALRAPLVRWATREPPESRACADRAGTRAQASLRWFQTSGWSATCGWTRLSGDVWRWDGTTWLGYVRRNR